MHEPTRESLRDLADDESFVRGMGYVAEGRVYDALLVDDRLTGRAVGSMEIAYEMEMILGPHGAESGRCTCPRGDFCKHLVALGLLCIEKPQAVARIDRVVLATRLRQLDPVELADLIVERAVDDPVFARRVLDRFDAPGARAVAAGSSVDFRTQVAQYREVASGVTPGWASNPYRAGHQYASGLRELLMHGAREASNHPVRLLAFYTAVYQQIEDEIAHLDDSDGVIGGAAAECVTGMSETVTHSDMDSDSRRAWLTIAVPLCLDNPYGIGDGLRDAIAQCGDSEEASFAIDLLRASLVEPADASEQGDAVESDWTWSREYRKTSTCELIAALLRRSAREQEIDALFLDAGLPYHYVLHRIALGDRSGAQAHAVEHVRKGYDVSRAARAFLDAGMVMEAATFLDHVAPLLGSDTPHRGDIVAAWAEAVERLGAVDRALDLRFQWFCERPSVTAYDAVMSTASVLDRTAEFDRKMIDAVSHDSHGSTAATEIHIHRRDVDAAIEAFDAISSYRSDDLALRLASLAAKLRPTTSRRLIANIVERQIAGRSRSNYARAAAAAGKLRNAMTEQELSEYLADLRLRYRRLPALQDELNQVFGK